MLIPLVELNSTSVNRRVSYDMAHSEGLFQSSAVLQGAMLCMCIYLPELGLTRTKLTLSSLQSGFGSSLLLSLQEHSLHPALADLCLERSSMCFKDTFVCLELHKATVNLSGSHMGPATFPTQHQKARADDWGEGFNLSRGRSFTCQRDHRL